MTKFLVKEQNKKHEDDKNLSRKITVGTYEYVVKFTTR